MVKHLFPIMMASVAARDVDRLDLQSDFDLPDRNLYEQPWETDHQDWDGSLTQKALIGNMKENADENRLCEDLDPKVQDQYDKHHQLEGETEKDIFKQCLKKNFGALKRYYYSQRTQNQPVGTIKMWMRKSDVLFSKIYYCEKMDTKLYDKASGDDKDRDHKTCRWAKSETWKFQVLDLDRISKKNPVKFKCNRSRQNRFRSFENMKCRDYDLEDMCQYGMPTPQKGDWEMLGRKNRNNRAIVDECCACSERRDPVTNNMRKKIKAFAKKRVDMKKDCKQPMDLGRGPRHNEISAWYYDDDAGDCYEFSYKGTKGNTNRFSSFRECEDVCIPFVTTRDEYKK